MIHFEHLIDALTGASAHEHALDLLNSLDAGDLHDLLAVSGMDASHLASLLETTGIDLASLTADQLHDVLDALAEASQEVTTEAASGVLPFSDPMMAQHTAPAAGAAADAGDMRFSGSHDYLHGNLPTATGPFNPQDSNGLLHHDPTRFGSQTVNDPGYPEKVYSDVDKQYRDAHSGHVTDRWNKNPT
jgi:hypothetical protein